MPRERRRRRRPRRTGRDRRRKGERRWRGRGTRADAGDDRAQEVRAAVEIAAVTTGPVVGAEQLVQQVAVAVLDVDEVEAGLRGPARRASTYSPASSSSSSSLSTLAASAPTRASSNGCSYAVRGSGVAVWSGVATGVRQLHAGDLVRREQVPQRGDVVDRRLVDDELVGVGPAVRPNRGCLPPHEPAPAAAEALPAPVDEVGGAAVGGAVPALHRQHRETVRHGQHTGAPSRISTGDDSTPSGSTSASTGTCSPRRSRWARNASSVSSFLIWTDPHRFTRLRDARRCPRAPPDRPRAGGERPAGWRRCSPSRGARGTSRHRGDSRAPDL